MQRSEGSWLVPTKGGSRQPINLIRAVLNGCATDLVIKRGQRTHFTHPFAGTNIFDSH